MIETVLCVDIGTTSLKTGLITGDGEVVSFSAKQFSNCEDRYISLSWKLSLKSAIGEMKQQCKWEEICIRALAISGNGPTLVAQNGLTYKWNEHIVWQLFEHYSEQANQFLRKSLFLPRIVMMKHLFPKEFAEGTIFSGPEYLMYQLTGCPVTILPEKRFSTAYWSEENLSLCDINPEKLPSFVGVGEICGYLKSAEAENLGLKAGIPVVSGGPDFVVALIGTNTLTSGNICDRCGSSEGFNYCVPKFITAPEIRTLPSVIPDLWNCSFLIPESGSLSETERFHYAKKAVASLKKISEDYKIPFPTDIVVTGGQAKDKALMQEKALVLGIKLSTCQNADAELLGDSCAAWYALGKYASLQDAANHIVKKEVVYEGV